MIRINIYRRWTKGSIKFSGYGKDFGKDIWKSRFRKGLVVIFAEDLAYLGVIERGKQMGVRVVSECLDDLRVSEVIKWFSVFNQTEPTTITPRINRLIYLEDPIPNQTGFIGSVSIRLFGSRIICPGLLISSRYVPTN